MNYKITSKYIWDEAPDWAKAFGICTFGEDAGKACWLAEEAPFGFTSIVTRKLAEAKGLTVKMLKQYYDKLPDHAQVFIEYPERYGRCTDNGVPCELTVVKEDRDGEGRDFLGANSLFVDFEKERLYITHHY